MAVRSVSSVLRAVSLGEEPFPISLDPDAGRGTKQLPDRCLGLVTVMESPNPLRFKNRIVRIVRVGGAGRMHKYKETNKLLHGRASSQINTAEDGVLTKGRPFMPTRQVGWGTVLTITRRCHRCECLKPRC